MVTQTAFIVDVAVFLCACNRFGLLGGNDDSAGIAGGYEGIIGYYGVIPVSGFLVSVVIYSKGCDVFI